jgi:hypothetical protein
MMPIYSYLMECSGNWSPSCQRQRWLWLRVLLCCQTGSPFNLDIKVFVDADAVDRLGRVSSVDIVSATFSAEVLERYNKT